VRRHPQLTGAALATGAFGTAKQLAQDRLQQFLQVHTREAIARWKARVHTIPGAARWLRQESATPFVTQHTDGHVITARHEAVDALRSYWSQIFGTI
jgi:hypothetical protein